MKKTNMMEKMNIIPFYFENDGVIPNNKLPLLIYKNALQYLSDKNFQYAFSKNNWTNNWQDIVLDYDHFHSNTHEVLGLAKGIARLKIGGDNGEIVLVETGDVIIMPAGVGHYSLDNSLDYQFVGGYPNGAEWNSILSLKNEDSISIIEEILNIPIPDSDPIFGNKGPLFDFWK
jgi:uncharacterized protein YjlB